MTSTVTLSSIHFATWAYDPKYYSIILPGFSIYMKEITHCKKKKKILHEEKDPSF